MGMMGDEMEERDVESSSVAPVELDRDADEVVALLPPLPPSDAPVVESVGERLEDAVLVGFGEEERVRGVAGVLEGLGMKGCVIGGGRGLNIIGSEVDSPPAPMTPSTDEQS